MGRNLTNLYISESFNHVLQISGSDVQDGLGNNITQTLNINVVSASYAVSASHEIIKEVSSSYADFAQTAGTANSASYVLGSNVDGTVANATDALYAQNTTTTGKNLEPTLIAKGTPLYFTGSGTAGNLVGIYRADAGNPNRMPAGGVAGEAIASGAEGIVLLDGYIGGVDTSLFAAGDEVFVAVGGGYTNVAPTGSANLIQHLGNVEKSAVNGSGVIQMMGEPRGLPNLAQNNVWKGDVNGVPQSVNQNTLSVATAVSSSFASTSISSSHALSANTSISSSHAVQADSALRSNQILVLDINHIGVLYPTFVLGTGDELVFTPSGNPIYYIQPLNTLVTNTSGSHTGSVNGDLFGTASYATFAVSASYAANAGDWTGNYIGNAKITGSLNVTGDIIGNGETYIKRALFDTNPFNGSKGNQLGATRLGDTNNYFYTTLYDSAYGFTSQSLVELRMDTGSGLFSTKISAKSGNTEARVQVFNNNGSRNILLDSDLNIISGSVLLDDALTVKDNVTITGSLLQLGNTTHNGNTTQTGYTTQNFTAPGTNQEIAFVNVSGAQVNGKNYGRVFYGIADYPSFGNQYEDYFAIEYYDGFGYNFGSEFNVNGQSSRIQTVPSGSGFGARAAVETVDNYNGTSNANVYGNFINIGGIQGNTNNINVGNTNSFTTFSGTNNFTGSTYMTSSTGFPLTVDGTFNVKRIHFDKNPFNSTPSDNLGALRLSANNQDFYTTIYNTTYAITSQSAFLLHNDTGSLTTYSEMHSDFAGTIGKFRITNTNGTRTGDIDVDTLHVTGSAKFADVINLAAQDPLPTGGLGDLSVSGSGLYFHNGTSWTLIS